MRDQVRLGALCWCLSVEFFVAQFAAQLAIPEHDLFLHDISMLGITTCGVHIWPTSGSTDLLCSPLHMVFNAGITLHGILIILGVWLTRSLWPSGLVAFAALVLIVLGGAGAMIVGAVPLDEGLPLHSHGAVLAVAAPGFAFLLVAALYWFSAPTFARWTALVGALVLLAGYCHTLGGIPFGRGTMERLAVWPQTIWFMVTGALVLASPATQNTGAKAFAPHLWPLRTGARTGAKLKSRHV